MFICVRRVEFDKNPFRCEFKTDLIAKYFTIAYVAQADRIAHISSYCIHSYWLLENIPPIWLHHIRFIFKKKLLKHFLPWEQWHVLNEMESPSTQLLLQIMEKDGKNVINQIIQLQIESCLAYIIPFDCCYSGCANHVWC